jgi:hypothetical protein
MQLWKFLKIILLTKRFGMLESNPGLSSFLLTVIERPPALPCGNLQQFIIAENKCFIQYLL